MTGHHPVPALPVSVQCCLPVPDESRHVSTHYHPLSPNEDIAVVVRAEENSLSMIN